MDRTLEIFVCQRVLNPKNQLGVLSNGRFLSQHLLNEYSNEKGEFLAEELGELNDSLNRGMMMDELNPVDLRKAVFRFKETVKGGQEVVTISDNLLDFPDTIGLPGEPSTKRLLAKFVEQKLAAAQEAHELRIIYLHNGQA
jgi:hypothetical protein